MASKELEERLTKDAERIEQKEKEISEMEQKILTTDAHIMETLEKNKEETVFISKIYHHRFLISIGVTVGIVLVWKGIGDLSAELPIVSTALGALAIGLILLFLINRYASPKN